jgi:propionyl-CoA synthetase
MQTVWGDDERYVKHLLVQLPGRQVYSTSTGAIRDQDGYYYILGRTDDVINVAGHRLGTREIEESISIHPNVAEVAGGGRGRPAEGPGGRGLRGGQGHLGADREAAKLKLEGEVMKVVDEQLGAVARPARVRFVTVLPKTRSGKLLRRAIQAVCEGRDPGDLTTIEDPTALQQIKDLVATR